MEIEYKDWLRRVRVPIVTIHLKSLPKVTIIVKGRRKKNLMLNIFFRLLFESLRLTLLCFPFWIITRIFKSMPHIVPHYFTMTKLKLMRLHSSGSLPASALQLSRLSSRKQRKKDDCRFLSQYTQQLTFHHVTTWQLHNGCLC